MNLMQMWGNLGPMGQMAVPFAAVLMGLGVAAYFILRPKKGGGGAIPATMGTTPARIVQEEKSETYKVRLMDGTTEVGVWIVKDDFEYIEDVPTGIDLTRVDNNKTVIVIPAVHQHIIIEEE